MRGTLRLDAVEARGGLRLLDLGENALAGGEIVPAALRQHQLARGPVQQLDAEPVFEGSHMLRHHRLGHIEGPRRSRETAERRNANEDLHAGYAVEH